MGNFQFRKTSDYNIYKLNFLSFDFRYKDIRVYKHCIKVINISGSNMFFYDKSFPNASSVTKNEINTNWFLNVCKKYVFMYI